MLLAVVRSHYGYEPRYLSDREKIYRAGNALAEWLDLDSWIDIVAMQSPQNVGQFREIVAAKK